MALSEEAVRETVRRVVLHTLGQEARAGSAARENKPTGQSEGPPHTDGQRSSEARPHITEADVLAVPGGGRLEVPAGALITPLARDAAAERGVELASGPGPDLSAPESGRQKRGQGSGSSPSPVVALGADHGGFRLKEELKGFLVEQGYEVTDCGTHSTDPVDYPDYAYAVARLVSDGRAWRGILVDGAGIGSCMAANKVPGIRAAMCHDHATAVNSREHNDANVLTLGGTLIGAGLARQIVKTWLDTPFGGERHARRVGKIMDIERRFSRK